MSLLLAAARRFLVLLLIASAVIVCVSLLFGALAHAGVDRSISVGFYLGGACLIVCGFFVGNRGPTRVKGESAAGMAVPWTGRIMRWASRDEQEETINLSAVFLALGFTLVLVGIAVDGRFSVV